MVRTSVARPAATLFAVSISVSVGSLLALSWASSAVAADCIPSQIRDGACVTGNITDGAAVLEGTTGSPGAGGGGAGSDGTAPVDPYVHCLVVVSDRCRYIVDHSTAVTQPITIADIAAFRPDAGVDHMQPNGWMIVGLDTNFFATGGVQVKDGTLLGQPASVRFTPRMWRWVYGDGSDVAVRNPGGTWAAQGIPEFDPTPTSHAYRTVGTYFIDLTIDYAVEYRFAGAQWIVIPGIIPVPANRLVATAGDAKTVLVQRECTVNPAGPGC